MTKFSYYKKLNKADKKIYNQSDEITFVRLNEAGRFAPYVKKLAKALEGEVKPETERIGKQLIWLLAMSFRVPVPRLKVLSRRPSNDYGELHGLYEFEDGPETAVITLWMRTVKRKQVVAFKTFLRTLVHEFCHHLDFTALKLDDSFHTQGFYSRESSLMKQLFPTNDEAK